MFSSFPYKKHPKQWRVARSRLSRLRAPFIATFSRAPLLHPAWDRKSNKNDSQKEVPKLALGRPSSVLGASRCILGVFWKASGRLGRLLGCLWASPACKNTYESASWVAPTCENTCHSASWDLLGASRGILGASCSRPSILRVPRYYCCAKSPSLFFSVVAAYGDLEIETSTTRGQRAYTRAW